MEELLKAIAAHPERFSDDTYLPCGLREMADAFADAGPARSKPADAAVVEFTAG